MTANEQREADLKDLYERTLSQFKDETYHLIRGIMDRHFAYKYRNGYPDPAAYEQEYVWMEGEMQNKLKEILDML